MTSAVLESKVAFTTAEIVKAIIPNAQIATSLQEDRDIAILSYQTSFRDLWTFDLTGPLIKWVTKARSRRSLVIVWDGMPDNAETINVSNFVLPADWAFAISMKLANDLSTPLPELRVHILDLRSGHHLDAFSTHSLPLLSAVAPWIQIYRPIQSEGIEVFAVLSSGQDDYALSLLRQAVQPGLFGLEALLDDLKNPSRIQSLNEAFSNSSRVNSLRAFASAYKNNLLSARTRHDVGNLLTPLLLVDALPRNRRVSIKGAIMQPFPLRTALRTLSKVVGLQERQAPVGSLVSNDGIVTDQLKAGDPFGRRTFLRVLLIDDQFPLGYQHLLASFLFGEAYDPSKAKGNENDWEVLVKGKGVLRCLSTAEAILSKLDAMTPVTDWDAPRLLDFAFDILVLDLRLWTDDKTRETFFSRMGDICTKLDAISITDLHFRKALRAVENFRNSPQNEIDGLVLLPLLLSHIDPSLPIVLFSSTQQRVVAEMVSHRPNIIADFSKPISSGYVENKTVDQTISLLERAISRAIELHESRKVWEEIVARARMVELNPAKFEFRELIIEQPDGTEKVAQFEITESSIKELAQEFNEYVVFGRFSDSLLAIGNWSEDLLGGKLRTPPLRTAETPAACAALKDLKGRYGSYEKAVKAVWGDPAYESSIKQVLNVVAAQVEADKKGAIKYVLNRARDGQPMKFRAGGMAALGLPNPLPKLPQQVMGQFLDKDPDAQSVLDAHADWVACLNKDIGSVTIAVTNAFRNARAHRRVRPSDSTAIRNLAIWCWLWTIGGLFPRSQDPLMERGDLVNLTPGLGIEQYIHLKRPLVTSNLSSAKQSKAFLTMVVNQLQDVLNAGWLKLSDADLKSALDRLVP